VSDERRGLRTIAGPASRLKWFVCLVSGHRWDAAPRRDTPMLRCVRCGMTAEPFTPR
jgi:Prophage protein (DUF1660)